MVLTFDEQSVRRISRAVRTVEGWPTHQVPDNQRRRRTAAPVPQVAIAQADIEHNDSGGVKFGSGSAMDSAIAPVGDEQQAYNPGLTVWEGSRLAIEHWALNGADSAAWAIRHAWSATRIRGRSSSEITPGSTDTITDVTALDGHYGPATATVYLPTELITVASGVILWAELAWNEATGVCRWEVYSADCS